MRIQGTLVAGLLVLALSSPPALGQVRYTGSPSGCGITFGRQPAQPQQCFKPAFNGGVQPGFNCGYPYGLSTFPYARSYCGSINPYLGYYYGYASPVIYSPPVYYYPPVYEAAPAAPAAPTYNQPPPVARDDARLPTPVRLPEPEANVAYIDLNVPADAQVWAQGVKMAGQGALRRFITRALEPGANYSYEFRILYSEGGKEASLLKHISVAAGDRKSLTIISGAVRAAAD